MTIKKWGESQWFGLEPQFDPKTRPDRYHWANATAFRRGSGKLPETLKSRWAFRHAQRCQTYPKWKLLWRRNGTVPDRGSNPTIKPPFPSSFVQNFSDTLYLKASWKYTAHFLGDIFSPVFRSGLFVWRGQRQTKALITFTWIHSKSVGMVILRLGSIPLRLAVIRCGAIYYLSVKYLRYRDDRCKTGRLDSVQFSNI